MNGPAHAEGQSIYVRSHYADFVALIWVVVKIMIPFWIPIIIRHLIFRVPKKGP